MARKHENFKWNGYKYAPETIMFSLNGKQLLLPEEKRSRLAYMAVCGKEKEVEDELKRFLRKEEKTPQVIGKCICFFKKNSNEFYYTQQLKYDPNDIQDALRCYKKWKSFIKTNNCVLETGYELSEGEFSPCGTNQATYRTITSVVDLTRCRSVKIFRKSII